MTNTITHFSLGIIIQRLRISEVKEQENSLLQAAECHHNLAVYAGIEFKELGIVVTIPLRPITNQKEKEKFRSHIYKPKGIVHYADSTYKGK